MKKIGLLLVDIRSTHNVGSILRSADCFGVKEVLITGYTPYPKINSDTRLPHVYKKITSSIHKTALGAEITMPVKVFNGVKDAFDYAKSKNYTLVALEQSPSSTRLDKYKLAGDTMIVLGNEVKGIPNKILKACDEIIEIPQQGLKESFNVSVAAAIALYGLRYNK